MIWRELKKSFKRLFFCSIDASANNSKHKTPESNCLSTLTSADQPVKHGLGLPVPEPPQSNDDILQSSSEFGESQLSTNEFQCSPEYLKPQLFTQAELNNL